MKPLFKYLKENKRGQIVTSIITGVVGLVIVVIMGFVVISTLLNANLLGGGVYNDTAQSMASNLTVGVNNVSSKIPTILLISAVVLLFGALVFLVAKARAMWQGQGGQL